MRAKKRSSAAMLAVVAVAFCVSSIRAQSIEELMSVGGDMLRSGDYGGAISAFKKVVGRDPGLFEAQFNLGFAYLASGRSEQALAELKKASGLNPRSSEVWANIGIAYENLGKTSQALDAIAKSVNLDPGNLEARLNLASLYAEKGRTNEAITQFKQILAIDAAQPVALTNLARLLVVKKEIAEAKRYLATALQVSPNNAEAQWELGNIAWKEEKNLDEAVKRYRTAITLEPNSQVFYDALGKVLEQKGDTAGAIEVYKKYLVYLNDALRKEDVQARIDRLEHPELAARKGGGSTGGAVRQDKENLDALRKEMRKDEASSEGSQVQMKGSSEEDILGDINDLTTEDGSAGLDLKAAAKKRAQENK